MMRLTTSRTSYSNCRWLRMTLVGVFIIILWGIPVYGEEPDYKSFKENANIEVGVATWLSQGQTNWNHDASSGSGVVGNPTSSLDYQDVTSNIVEINARLTHRKGFSIRGQFGYGAITDGTLIDDDFVSANGATFFGTSVNGPHRISRTESSIDDSYVLYMGADLGVLYYHFAEGKGSANAFFGFQYWKEKYEARGVTQIECTSIGTFCSAPGTVSNAGQLAITNTVGWKSIRVGAEGSYQFFDRFTLEGNGAFIPFAWLDNEDIHHLRSDLQQDPSFSMTGRGYGFNVEGLVRARLFDSLYLHGGYRYWWLTVKNGEWQNHPIAGPSSTVNLNEFRTFRHGAIVGLSYLF